MFHNFFILFLFASHRSSCAEHFLIFYYFFWLLENSHKFPSYFSLLLQNLNKNKQNIYKIEIVVTEAHDRIVNVFENTI